MPVLDPVQRPRDPIERDEPERAAEVLSATEGGQWRPPRPLPRPDDPTPLGRIERVERPIQLCQSMTPADRLRELKINPFDRRSNRK